MKQIKKIGIFTSGGDAQGMNASIRAIVRRSLHLGIEVIGVKDGLKGLIEGDFFPLTSEFVSAGMMHRGGTKIGTSRCPSFYEDSARQQAYNYLKDAQIDVLIAIGGNGTYQATKRFHKEFNVPVVIIPATIDNNMPGTDYTIGYDTALHVILDYILKIKTTADSHNRIFIIEIMGDNSPRLALSAALTSGAEGVYLKDKPESLQTIKEYIQSKHITKNRRAAIILTPEGDKDPQNLVYLADQIKGILESSGQETTEVRTQVIGAIQRGGMPTPLDLSMGSSFGYFALEAACMGISGMIGSQGINIYARSFDDKASTPLGKNNETFLLKMINELSA